MLGKALEAEHYFTTNVFVKYQDDKIKNITNNS